MESPFRPGFGQPPLVLAGREELLDDLRVRLEGTVPFHHAVLGPRGEGKTVLLREVERWAGSERGWATVWHDCDRGQALSQVLARRLVDAARTVTPVWEQFSTDMARRLNISVGTFVKVSVSPRPDDGFHADSILTDTVESLGRTAAAQRTKVVIFVDELQSLGGGSELVRLSQALQNANGNQLPVHSVHAGLSLPAPATDQGGSFLERIGTTELGNLDRAATRLGLLEPFTRAGIDIDTGALDRLVSKSQGYPYFMQLYGDGAWDQWRRHGATGAVTVDQVNAGIRARRADVDRLYRGRFERLAPAQRQFMLAAAHSVDDRGVAHISQIEQVLSQSQTSFARTRLALIERHQLLEPVGPRGELRFVLPEYDSWLRNRGIDRAEIEHQLHNSPDTGLDDDPPPHGREIER